MSKSRQKKYPKGSVYHDYNYSELSEMDDIHVWNSTPNCLKYAREPFKGFTDPWKMNDY